MPYRETRSETHSSGKTRVTVKREYYETQKERERKESMEKVVKTATKPVIAGLEVSQEVYNDYANRTYQTSIGQMQYKTLELYATGSGLAQEAPELSEECRAIREQIRNEIEVINKQETQYSTAKHADFTGYLEDLGKLYQEATNERKQMVAAHETAIQKYDQEAGAASAAGSDARLLKAKADRAEENERFQEETQKFHEKVTLQINAAREGVKALVSDFYDVNAERLDDNAMKLLNSGLKLTEHELSGLFKKFANNTTMLRMIADYCEAHDIDKQDAAVYGGRARSNGSHEMEVFEGLAERLTLAVGFGSDISEKVWSPENGHFDNVLTNSINELKNTLVKP